jgi:hypothetical protein
MDKNKEIMNKIIDLKNKIENEINKINALYDKAFDDMNLFFKKEKEKLSNEQIDNNNLNKYELLLKKENDMKDKLQFEITKTKEQLENNLSLVNEEIRINERLNKGINKLKSDKNLENNIFRILTYISEINNNYKKLQIISKKKIKNLKISFKEEQNNILYEEYYFNGISIPQDLEFGDIAYNSLNLTWKINHINNINIDNKQIKYKVEMGKNNEPFIEVYVGKNLKCNINDLEPNTNYKFRICCLYNDIMGDWSEIKEIKTKNFDFDSFLKKQNNFRNYRIESGEISEDVHNTKLYNSTGDRSYIKHIYFNKKYETIPNVHASITGLDIINSKNARLKVLVENIDQNGFDIKIFTWADTIIYWVKVSWISSIVIIIVIIVIIIITEISIIIIKIPLIIVIIRVIA